MRRLHLYLTLAALPLCAAPAYAQADPPPPPPPSPDYSPERWKERVYDQDDMKFRLPAGPEVTAETEEESFGKVTRRTYPRRSFHSFGLTVQE